ncbi:MAG: ATP-binding protein [Oscillospiraceae bacterium]
MSKSGNTTELVSSLMQLGSLAEFNAAPSIVQQLNALCSNGKDDLQLIAFNNISETFELDAAEQLILANSLWLFCEGKSFHNAMWMSDFCTAIAMHSKEKEISFLLCTQPDTLLVNACCILLGRTAQLPLYAELEIGGDTVFHGEDVLSDANDFLNRCQENSDLLPAAIVFSGEAGVGKRFLQKELAHMRGCILLNIDCNAATISDTSIIAGIALLYSAMIALTSYTDEAEKLMNGLFNWFCVLLIATNDSTYSIGTRCKALLLREIKAMSAEERQRAISVLFPSTEESERVSAAQTYHTSPARLIKAAARMKAEGKEQSLTGMLREENLLSLLHTAELLQTNKYMKDLVLPCEAKQQLERLCAFVRVRSTVWKQWGFDSKIPYGRGTTALFYGASGTGKTLAAGIVANELGMPLYRVDLSQLISKYIGETQKNIGQIFDNAKNMDCILFFDEADALFASRGENSDAQDRYANAETAYLLQRTEQYDGIILLATNLLQNFDEAFRRRIDCMIHFPLPDKAMREQLWQSIFPKEAPTKQLDFALLAQQLELSGAGIRNCALTAAYLAASQHTAIDMRSVVIAAQGEYQKLGKAFPTSLMAYIPPERRT